MVLAFKRLAPIAFFGVLPAIILILVVHGMVHAGPGTDFRQELYPEAKLVLQGRDPFPGVHANLSGGANRIFPIPGALLIAPLTLVRERVAEWVFAAISFVLVIATAWIAGVRDWRIYGVLALSPPTIAAIQSGNLTIVLGVLVAVAWRYRDHRYVPGIAVGAMIALKLFLWPLLFWLLAIRAYRSAALGAAIGFIGGVLAVLPFTSISHFVRVEQNLARVFAPRSYNLVGLLVQSGTTSYRAALVASYVVGLAMLYVAYRRRSLPLSVSASLILSPIVWLHYFVLLVVPIAVRRPALAGAWFVPLCLWVCPGTSAKIQTWQIAVALAVLAAVSVLNEIGPIPFGRAAKTQPAVASSR